MISGSMFKVPLNMLFTEKVGKGELAMDDLIGGYRYSELLKGSIVHSNNDYAKILWNEAGRWIENENTVYHRYRELIAPYMGEDPENVDEKYYENNFFTPRQMINCLKLLAENPDRFPGLIENMQLAEPHKYFKRDEQRFDMAHKYGYLTKGSTLYLCDCAIAYTDDPIVFVMFTDGVDSAYSVMADYATMMCDYTQYNTAQRLEAEKKAKAEEEAKALANAENQHEDKEEAAKSMNDKLSGESLVNAGADMALSAGSGNSVGAWLHSVLYSCNSGYLSQ
ncbi:peptidase family S11 [gut metagenome]|uniref:Peptidase family S11 n=1 Tax=gut metagenome TaxID=749906 RepID=J9G138_9ZZZZ